MWSPQGQSPPTRSSYRHKALSSFASETDRWDSTVLPTLRAGKRKVNAPGSYGVGNNAAATSDASTPVSRFKYLRERTMARFRGRVDSKFHESVVPNSVLRGGGDRQGGDDNGEDEEQKFFVHEDIKVPFRLQLRHILTSSSIGVAIDLISCALSVIACIFYVWSTYDESLETLFLFIEAGISAFFLLEYMLRFYVTNNRVRFFFSWFSIVDILTIVPVVFDLLLHESITGTSLAFRIIQILRVLRIARLLRIHRVFTYLKTELQRETARFILNMISITFITAAFIFAIENSLREELYVEPLLFHDAYYFTIVTVSTVGFGDIKVYTQLSRAFIVLVIIGSLVYIPMSTNALLRLLSEDSMYRLRRYRPRRARHVLVLGEIHADGALKFLQEFFHPDHGTQDDVHVVFLMGNLPSAELKMVLESQRYEMSVTYLQGSVHSIEDLDRARAWDVAAVFVLARKFTVEEAEVDRSTMMIALAIKQYHYRVLGSPVQICLQLIRPESQKQYALAFRKIGRKNESYREINSQQRPSNGSIASSIGALTPVGTYPPNRHWQQSASVEDVVRSEIKVVPSPMPSSQNGRRVSDSKRRNIGSAVNQNRRESEGPQSEPLSGAADILALMQTHQALPRQQSSLSVASKTPLQGPQKTGLGPQDIVICTNQLKMELMAKHCLCPGITTFITNLVISLDDDAHRDRGVDSLAPWEKEYRAGCDFELYRTKLTQGFSGIHFEDIALALYMETGTLVIGVEVSAAMHMTDGSTHAKSRLLLNPVGFVIPDTTEFSVHAIVIAQDRASANLSTWRSNPQEPGKGGGGLTASFYGLTAPAQKVSSMKFNSQNVGKPETEASRIEAKVRMYNPTEARPGIEISRKMAEFDSASLQHQISSGSRDKRAYGAASERLRRAKIHSQLCEEHPSVKNHVVFIGSTTDFAAFVRILRHKTKGATKSLPVVVLSTTMPSVQTWAALPGKGEHVYIVEGSPLDTFDLKRAGVHYASCAVVSTTQGQMKQAGRALSVDNQRDDSEALAVADADAIFAHQGILRLNPDIEIITEVVNTENIVFLETKSRLLHKAERHLSFHVAPKETANGAHRSPSQVQGVAATLPDAGDEEIDGTVDIGKNDRHTRGLIASGTIFTISLLDALLAQSFYNPKVLAVLEQLLAGESQTEADAAMWTEVLGEASSSLMYVASVPEEFEEATYGDVFRYFCLEKGMLSVGISRGVTLRRAGISTLGNRHRYVLTNPPAETVLQRQDKIFVLALMEPEEETRGGGMLDVLSAFQQKRPGPFAAGESAAPAAITSLLPTTKPGTGDDDGKAMLPSSKTLHPESELRETSAPATSKSEAPAFKLGGNSAPSTQIKRQSKRPSTLDSGGLIDLAEEIREDELLEIDKDEQD